MTKRFEKNRLAKIERNKRRRKRKAKETKNADWLVARNWCRPESKRVVAW